MREANRDCRELRKRPVSKESYAVALIMEAVKGEQEGLVKYGPFDPVNDKRILSREANDEMRDAFNYMSFLKRKRPDLKDDAMDAQRKILDAYIALRQLEDRERGIIEADPSQVQISARR